MLTRSGTFNVPRKKSFSLREKVAAAG